MLAFGLTDAGAYQAALQIAKHGRQRARDHDMVLVRFLNLLVLGMVCRALLAPEPARAADLEAADLNQRVQSEPRAEMIAAHLCADYALAGDWQTAGGYARQALALRNYSALPLVIAASWLETEALLRCGDSELAHDAARRQGALIGHIPRYRLPHLRSLAAEDTQQAQAVFTQAAEIVQGLAARIDHQALRTVYVAAHTHILMQPG